MPAEESEDGRTAAGDSNQADGDGGAAHLAASRHADRAARTVAHRRVRRQRG